MMGGRGADSVMPIAGSFATLPCVQYVDFMFLTVDLSTVQVVDACPLSANFDIAFFACVAIFISARPLTLLLQSQSARPPVLTVRLPKFTTAKFGVENVENLV